MKARQLMRKLLWILFFLIVFMIFAGLDWFPTLKDLNLLRREQRDEELRIKNVAAIASSFVFPDREEKSLFAHNNALLHHSLLQVDDDDAWLAMVLLELQAQIRTERIVSARVFFSIHALGTELDAAGPGQPAVWVDWLLLQYQDIQESFNSTFDSSRYLWYGVFSGLEAVRRQRLASRPLAVALAAPLPALLDFINHISWGEARLEIVRLHLEPGLKLSRAWLVCRTSYLVRKPSAWAVKMESRDGGEGLLVDPDSPLLWQKVGPGIAYRVEKSELAPDAGWKLD